MRDHSKERSPKDFEDFSATLDGEVCHRTQPSYEHWHQQSHWNAREFKRFPDCIVRAQSVNDVIATVRFARSQNLSICVRSGGHSFSGTFLRRDGILLDMAGLRQIGFDATRMEAVVGPGVSSGELSRELARFGCGFPTGHTGSVGIAGFLLGGGLGINFGAWGAISAFNVMALDVVMADGQLKHVSPDENRELLWAARGAGPGLFFVVVRFYLKCMPLPNAITARSLRLPFGKMGAALAEIARIDPDRRLQVMLAVIPAADGAGADEDHGREALLSTIAFADDAASATAFHASVIERLEPLSIEPASVEQSTSFEAIHHQGDETFSVGRYRTDNILTERPEEAVRILASHLSRQPSSESLPLFIWRGSPELTDAAYSATGSFYFSTYARWREPKDDEVNRQWLIALYDELQAVSSHCYINEFDLEARSSDAKRCFSTSHWQRLLELKRVHDPENVFHDFYLGKC